MSSDHATPPRHFYLGLATLAAATLVLEVLNTRLFSVLTWYHLAFLAISLAMLGLTAGAVYTYLRAASFPAAAVPAALGRHTLAFALSLPLSHLLLLLEPIPAEVGADAREVLGLAAASGTAAVPFFFAGVALALALTRVALPIGRIYAADLLGAGAGCLGALALLDRLDPTSVVLLLAAPTALAALAFRPELRRAAVATAVALGLLGAANAALYPRLLRIDRMKGRPLPHGLAVDRWNSHSRVTGRKAAPGRPTYWGRGRVAPAPVTVEQMLLRIDGGAFTVATGFDGDRASLGWLAHDVTALGHHLKPGAEVAVLGVGGGRDLLTALAFGSRRVTGIEVNRTFLHLLEGPLRSFAGLADRPEVRLVHAEGRSFLARPGPPFELIQMALVDTWASTAAGAMTLSENGLYTVEAWRLFARRLAPDGVLAVSRWYAADRPGETARLLSLAVATLLAEGVGEPRRHLALAGAGNVATLLLAKGALTESEIARLREAAARHGFQLLLAPGRPPADRLLAGIVAARSPAELARATAHPALDLSPPSDDRPFFFNMLRPRGWLEATGGREEASGVIAGNLRATGTLLAVLATTAAWALAAILVPLVLLGRRHGLAPGRFAAAAAYFSLIGLGFMLVEIALIQRSSLLLGHPVYALAVTLMSLVAATGLGSLLSDRLSLSRRAGAAIPALAIAVAVAAVAAAVGPLAARTEALPLAGRVAVVLGLTLPLGLLLGTAFPVGMRLLRRSSPFAMSWMWGLNGAFGVVGSALAVVVSMNWGISRCLGAGAACYLLLALPAARLWRDRMPEV
jgi:spermidine synthase